MACLSLSTSFATILESSPLSANRVTLPFANNFWDSSSMYLNVLQQPSGVCNCNQSVRVLNQPSASICLIGILVDGRGRDVLLEPIQLRYEILEFLLDIFELLHGLRQVWIIA